MLKNNGLSKRSAQRIAGISPRLISYELKQRDKNMKQARLLFQASVHHPGFGSRRFSGIAY